MIYSIGIVNQNMILVDFHDTGDTESLFITDRIHVMQSTGLFDKNGVEVFDGDIVNAYDTDRNEGQIYKTVNLTGVVTYRENAFCLKQGNVLNDLWVHSEEFEVIGNIYENPELLESVEG